MRTLLVRGLISGLIAGVFATIFAYFVSEPWVDKAVAFERAHSHEHEKELVSRGIQSTLGLLTGMTLVGIALGGLFAIVFALVYGRFGLHGPRAYAALLAIGAFGAVNLVPFLKYPANPPSVGSAATIDSRTDLYFSFLGISVIVAGLALYASRVFAERLDGWLSGLACFAGYGVVMALVGAVMPAVNEVPSDFPATVLWNFRVSSLGDLAVLWTVLTVVFGTLVHRSPASKADASDAVSVKA